MKIIDFKLRRIQIPFIVTFKHFLKSRSHVESVIVEIHLESGVVGYGEAIPREYVTGETVDSVVEKLSGDILPKLKNITLTGFDRVLQLLNYFEAEFDTLNEYDLCVKCALETALLDAAGKEYNKSVLDLLGGPKTDKIVYSAIISADSPERVGNMLALYKKMDMDIVKLKVGKDLNTDIQNIQLIRDALGTDCRIRVDANGAWSLQQAKRCLDSFLTYGVECVEQPFPKEQKKDYPRLSSYLDGQMDIAVDESLCSFCDALWIIENQGASVFNLRISKNGGLLNCLRLYKLASENGIKCQLGAQVGETSLLSSAGRILGVLLGDLSYHEGSFGNLLLSYDLTPKPLQFYKHGIGPAKEVYKQSGLGIDVDPLLLNKMTLAMAA